MKTKRATRAIRSLVALVAVGVIAAIAYRVRPYVKSAALLAQFSSDAPSGAALRPWKFFLDEVVEAEHSLELPDGTTTRARLYQPATVRVPAPAIVVAHGVHRLGIDEPRLQRFARSLAAAGVTVFTPEIVALTDYRIDRASVATLGAATRALSAISHHCAVGLLGLSFAGGLALLTAVDPRYEASVAFVVPVGAYDDLTRVLNFLLTNKTIDPKGRVFHQTAHEYGALVFAYAYLADLFPPEDVALARVAIRHRLSEDHKGAQAMASQLSVEGQGTLDLLFHQRAGELAPMRALLATHQDEATGVSVGPHLATLHVPVFLLHGAGDTVIPATETAWLAQNVPARYRRDVLVSQAIQHVEMHGTATWWDRGRLVAFMAKVLQAAETEISTPLRTAAINQDLVFVGVPLVSYPQKGYIQDSDKSGATCRASSEAASQASSEYPSQFDGLDYRDRRRRARRS